MTCAMRYPNALIRSALRVIALAMSACSAAAGTVTVMAGPQTSDEIHAYIAEAAVPEPRTVAAGASIEMEMRAKCGRIHSLSYLQEFVKLNKGAIGEPAPISMLQQTSTTLIFPACVYFRLGPVKVSRAQEESEEEVAVRHMGHGGRLTVERIKKGTKVLLDQQAIGPGDLVLPYVSRPTRIEVREGISTDEFIANLRKRQGRKTLEDQIVFVQVVSEGMPNESPCVSTPTTAGVKYPFDDAEVVRATGLNAWLAKNISSTATQDRPVTVVVLDDGLLGFDETELTDKNTFPSTFPKAILHFYQPIFPLNHVEETFGETLTPSQTKPHHMTYLPVPHSEKFRHGTHVSGLVHGGAYLRKLKPFLRRRLFISHLNIIDPKGEKPDWGNLARALDNLDTIGSSAPMIVNSSLGFGRPFPRIKKLEREGKDVLIVAAAGNNSSDLEAQGGSFLYPAQYGGYSSLNTITVAAHDANGELLKESNWGAETVDLAAAGCNLMSYAGQTQGELSPMSGTSQAAPVVTMTAGMLASYGLPNVEIKRRLWQTARIGSLGLWDTTSAKGKLDVARAIAASFDIVALAPNETIFGAIDQQTISLCETKFAVASLERVDVGLPVCSAKPDDVCIRIVRSNPGASGRTLQNYRSPIYCAMPRSTLAQSTLKLVQFEVRNSDGEVEIKRREESLASIQTIIPSTQGDDRKGLLEHADNQ